jgi:transposase
MISPLDALPDDPATLKAIILTQRAEAERMAASVRAYEALIQALKIRIAKLKRQTFGPSSEKIEREIDQLQLALEDLEVAMATAEAKPEPTEAAATTEAPAERAAPRRRGKPRIAETTPRERVDPGECCPDCGGPLRLVNEDVAEILELVAAQLKVIETARLKKSCRQCERIVQPPAPTRPISRGMAGPGLLAHILVAKYDDHLPLYRQGEIFARHGADIPRSTLIDWCGQAIAVLRPLIERIKANVMCTDRLHADDTPIQVLDPMVRQSRGKARAVKEGRIWVYVRDDRPWGGKDPPGVAYYFSPDRKGEHPQGHLAEFNGVLQADAYGGFAKLYQATADTEPRIREAACRVGGDVAGPAPHRPGRADFPHPVPRARASLTGRHIDGRSSGVGGGIARAWRGSAARTACCAARAA